jgi:4-hydroxymandelate oxidase
MPPEARAVPAELPLHLDEYEEAARACLSRGVFDYFAGGAEDEVTLRANRTAYQSLFLRPRVLVDVHAVDTSLELCGQKLNHPVFLAPAAFQCLAHPEGECVTARAAGSSGALLIASMLATRTIEEMASAATGPLWFQVYMLRDRDLVLSLVRRAEAAGACGLCLTVTVPTQGRRERDERNAFTLPPGVEMANLRGHRQAGMPEAQGSRLAAYIGLEFDPTVSWQDLKWLCTATRLPVLVKGILSPADATLALDHGAAGIIVSNHGGRQLDTAEPTIVALPRVVKAVADRAPVLVDGGIRRGSDIIKALALGARAVGIGRPYLWGLTLAGQAGVEAVIEHLRTELVRTMMLVGHASLASLDSSLISEWRPAH